MAGNSRRVFGLAIAAAVLATVAVAVAVAVALAPGRAASGASPPGSTNVYGKWSRTLFADATIVSRPVKTIYIAGMAAEDPDDGHIHDPGDVAAQCRMAYGKIKRILADQGAGMRDIVRTVAYLTDMSRKKDYEACQREALGDAPPPPHTLLGVSSLAWPGMVVEVEVTAALPRD